MVEMKFITLEKNVEMPDGRTVSYIEYDVLKDDESVNYIMDDDFSDDQIDEIDAAIKQLRKQTPKRLVINREHPIEFVIREIQMQHLYGVI